LQWCVAPARCRSPPGRRWLTAGELQLGRSAGANAPAGIGNGNSLWSLAQPHAPVRLQPISACCPAYGGPQDTMYADAAHSGLGRRSGAARQRRRSAPAARGCRRERCDADLGGAGQARSVDCRSRCTVPATARLAPRRAPDGNHAPKTSCLSPTPAFTSKARCDRPPAGRSASCGKNVIAGSARWHITLSRGMSACYAARPRAARRHRVRHRAHRRCRCKRAVARVIQRQEEGLPAYEPRDTLLIVDASGAKWPLSQRPRYLHHATRSRPRLRPTGHA
jgi:hypothetical protein